MAKVLHIVQSLEAGGAERVVVDVDMGIGKLVVMSGSADLMDAAMTKIHLSESLTRSALDAIAVHGGEGYLTAAGIERNLRDALGATIYSGTADVQRNIVASLLGL